MLFEIIMDSLELLEMILEHPTLHQRGLYQN